MGRMGVAAVPHGDVTCMASDGHQLYAGLSDGRVAIWEVKTWKLVGTFIDHSACVDDVVVDSRYVYTASVRGAIHVWHKGLLQQDVELCLPKPSGCRLAQTGSCLYALSLEGYVPAWWKLYWTPAPALAVRGETITAIHTTSSSLFFSTDIGRVFRWDTRKLRVQSEYITADCGVSALTYTQGRLFGTTWDGSLCVWNVSTGWLEMVVSDLHVGACSELAADDRHVYVLNDRGHIVVWDSIQSTVVVVLPTFCIQTFYLTFDGTYLYTPFMDRYICVWRRGQWRQPIEILQAPCRRV